MIKILENTLNITTISDCELSNYVEGYDKFKIFELLKLNEIELVITSGYTPNKDYEIRRLTVDLNIPIVLSVDTALFLVKSFNWFWKNNNNLTVLEMSKYYNKFEF